MNVQSLSLDSASIRQECNIDVAVRNSTPKETFIKTFIKKCLSVLGMRTPEAKKIGYAEAQSIYRAVQPLMGTEPHALAVAVAVVKATAQAIGVNLSYASDISQMRENATRVNGAIEAATGTRLQELAAQLKELERLIADCQEEQGDVKEYLADAKGHVASQVAEVDQVEAFMNGAE